MSLVPKRKDYKQIVHDSFARQKIMQTMGIQLRSVEAGRVVLSMAYDEKWSQQHGYLHAGAVTTALDSACGYAAFSLMPHDAAVLSIEFKTNMLRPAHANNFEFVGEVIKAGKMITVVDGKAYAIQSDQKKLIATMTGTMMTVLGKGIVG